MMEAKWLSYFKACSDITRLRILALLSEMELNVNDLMKILSMGQSRVSRHLKILMDSGLISCRKDGLWSFYRLRAAQNSDAFITILSQYLEKEPVFYNDKKAASENLNSQTENFFNSIAGSWEDEKKVILGDFSPASLFQRFFSSDESWIDFGCGTGDLIWELRHHNGQITGLDSSEEMLNLCREKFAGFDAIKFIKGNILHSPLPSGSADILTLNMVLHHLPDPQLFFEEAARVLKTNGILLVFDFKKHSQEIMREKFQDRWLGFSEETIMPWISKNNLTLKSYETINLQKMDTFCLAAVKN